MDRAIPHQRQGEAGASQSRNGANSAPERASPTKLQIGFQFLTKDFQDSGWLTSARRVTARDQLPRRDTRHTGPGMPGNRGWDRRGEKVPYTRGECARQAPGCLSCSDQEGIKRRPNRACAFVEYPKTGTARDSGPAPCRATWSLSSVDGEDTHTWAGANPVWPEHCECSPHTAVFVCSTPPSPQHDWTSEPKQETTSTHLCQGGN